MPRYIAWYAGVDFCKVHHHWAKFAIIALNQSEIKADYGKILLRYAKQSAGNGKVQNFFFLYEIDKPISVLKDL